MGTFAPKYPSKVDDAIRTAIAEGMATTKILSRLRAGTLDGLDGQPIEISDRTFYRRLSEARKRLSREPASGGFSRLDLLLLQEERRVAAARAGEDAPDVIGEFTEAAVSLKREGMPIEEIAEQTGLGPNTCKWILERAEPPKLRPTMPRGSVVPSLNGHPGAV